MSTVSTFINSAGNTTYVPDEFDYLTDGASDGLNGVWTLVPEGTNGAVMPGLDVDSDFGIAGTLPVAQPVVYEEGADLRDLPTVQPSPTGSTEPWWGWAAETEPTSTAGAPAGVAAVGLIALALRTLLAMVGRGGRVTRLAYSRLATWQKFVLQGAGIVIGTILSNELVDRLMGGDGDGSDGEMAQLPAGTTGLVPRDGQHMDIEGVHLGAHIIGQWVANGVTFYKLSDGKQAVRRKNGTWRIWRPKKPIVIYSDGSSSLKTLLRADAAVTRQAKKLYAMLQRRANPTRRTRKKADPVPQVIHVDAGGHH